LRNLEVFKDSPLLIQLFPPCASQWNADQIAFHKQGVNDALLKHGGATIIPNYDDETCANPVRVFVPLCGKTVDMAFLAKHGSVSEVVGIEGIRKALESYAEEQPDLDIKPVESLDTFERFVGKKTTLLKGDFFALDSDATGGKFDSIWDRGSMVAIDPRLRESYVNVMKNLLKPGGTILLVTLERRTGTDEGVRAGPPFSLSEEEVRAFYESQDWVDSVSLLDERDEFATSPEADITRFTSSGLTSLFELVFKIKAKA